MGSEATVATMLGHFPPAHSWEPEDVSGLERVTQELVAPPFLPEHEQTYDGPPRVVEVRMVVSVSIDKGATSSGVRNLAGVPASRRGGAGSQPYFVGLDSLAGW